MSDLKIDESLGDIQIIDGDLVFIDTKEDLAIQAVRITFRTFRGEWFRNLLFGVPWTTNNNNAISLLGKTSKIVFDSYIKKAILSNEEVVSIISYESVKDPSSGVVTVSAKLEIESGYIEISEEIQ